MHRREPFSEETSKLELQGRERPSMLYLQKKKDFLRWETVKGQDKGTQFLREEAGLEACPPSPQQCPDILKSHTLLATSDPETLSYPVWGNTRPGVGHKVAGEEDQMLRGSRYSNTCC